jgi:hypothetical protein
MCANNETESQNSLPYAQVVSALRQYLEGNEGKGHKTIK